MSNIIDYHALLNERDLSKKRYSFQLRSLKKELHKDYVKDHKLQFRLLDIAIVLIILFNMGALFMTNFLVMKASPEIQIQEANPKQCDWNGYTCHPEGNEIMFAFLFQIIFWGIIIILYLYYRTTLFTDFEYYILIIIIIFWLIGFGTDFINDLGYYLGKVIYGSII